MASPIRLPIRGADTAGDAVRQTIRAYHGSPYDFDRFDASKIGTGEGAQAYGHGLYFAGDEGVAQYYKTKLAGQAPFESPDQVAAEYLKVWGEPSSSDWSAKKSPALAIEKLRQHAIDPGSYGYDAAQGKLLREAAELLSRGDKITPKERSGRMYEVEIRHPEEALLDYDAMAESQSPPVQQALRRLGFDAEPGLPPSRRLSAKVIMERLGDSGGRRRAASTLLDAGVPGVKYLDAVSRTSQAGTRNYVMFPGTEDQIRILRKYGLLAPMAAAGTMGEE
jgi:hypothetical protein